MSAEKVVGKKGDKVTITSTCPRGCCVRAIYKNMIVDELVTKQGAWCRDKKGVRIFAGWTDKSGEMES